ncbi:coiled-coil domain-containing protein 43-like [Ruditapes philippinarum]|uniref:coiled-coil domain-containing protein 43-like n=1 Tax=Ruditapes philippinarum TaxID=129788 RepID=UPI00295AD3BB|nr:coiled-coil domain-containing protein 43-like [Ruditapes philippinarum]
MAASTAAFESWLTEKLLSLNPDTDTDVFVSYITGILDEDSSSDEKKESITELIGQVVEDGQQNACDEICDKWEEIHGSKSQENEKGHSAELTDHLAVILEKQKIETVKTREKTAEEVARKAAILAQYAHVSSGEEDDADDQDGDNSVQDSDLLNFKNVNAESVKKTELEMREKSRLEAEKKREKDKQDRETQKEKQKERKEGEKKRTQKGERRR